MNKYKLMDILYFEYIDNCSYGIVNEIFQRGNEIFYRCLSIDYHNKHWKWELINHHLSPYTDVPEKKIIKKIGGFIDKDYL